ncbi:MAG: CmcI family methyltransferase [Actinomycetota bacterium]
MSGRGNPSEPEQGIVDAFHRLYYNAATIGGTWANTSWLGVATEKCPLDLWVYQEILHEVRPDIIVETGTRWGGSALFLASMCDILGKGQVITIDIDVPGARPSHERITYLLGSSTSQTIVDGVRRQVAGAEHVIVVLDSDHSMSHVLSELRAYSDLVSVGSYLLVEDTNINGNPVLSSFGPGPMEAVERFLEENRAFEPDRSREKFLLTFNPKGFLRKIM